jgi:hypothetical protein
MIIMVQPPIAQSMTLRQNSSGTVKIVKPKIVYSKKPLSANTNPTKIRTLTHRAWKNKEFRWNDNRQWQCFDNIIKKESAWNPWSTNGAGWEETGGIPQAHPSRKMAEAGKDYRSNVWTQIRWGLKYIRSAYGTPCSAWDAWQGRAANGSYGWY